MGIIGKVCALGVWDESIPGIKFDKNGVSNYASIFYKLCEIYPRGDSGKKKWEAIVKKVKQDGKGKKYNCIIGVSGGSDSSYLLYILKNEYKLKPLAVNVDNGWNSDIAYKNIKIMTNSLNIDLETYVINYEEIKSLLRCFMMASLPWIDFPTDFAIKSALYLTAARENVKYIFRGNDFRSEGFQPREWTYGDRRLLFYINKKFGKIKLNTFPDLPLLKYLYYVIVKKIKEIYPYYYLEYSKQEAINFLSQNFNWNYYGAHHFENIFTKFAISYWLPVKFGIDKRKITLSAQVLSGKVDRNFALKELEKPPYDETIVERIDFILKKLDLSKEEFNFLLKTKNKYYYDYPSYDRLFFKYRKLLTPFLNKIMGYKAISLVQQEMRY